MSSGGIRSRRRGCSPCPTCYKMPLTAGMPESKTAWEFLFEENYDQFELDMPFQPPKRDSTASWPLSLRISEMKVFRKVGGDGYGDRETTVFFSYATSLIIPETLRDGLVTTATILV